MLRKSTNFTCFEGIVSVLLCKRERCLFFYLADKAAKREAETLVDVALRVQVGRVEAQGPSVDL